MKKLENYEMRTLLGGELGNPTLAASTVVCDPNTGETITKIDSPYCENDDVSEEEEEGGGD